MVAWSKPDFPLTRDQEPDDRGYAAGKDGHPRPNGTVPVDSRVNCQSRTISTDTISSPCAYQDPGPVLEVL